MTFRQKLQRRAIKNQSPRLLRTFTPYDVILGPLLTEKTHTLQESQNKYLFKVNSNANKQDIITAIKYLYKVSPIKINVTNVVFKERQQRGLVRKAYKKAVVTLGKKEKIDMGI